MKLYTYYRSSAAYRVRITLNLKGIAYESLPRHLSRGGGEQRQPAFLALNPQGLVPVLEDAGSTLTQNNGASLTVTNLVAAANGGLLLASAGVPTGTFGGTQVNTGNNFNLAMTQIGTRTAWTPVTNLTLSAEFTYSRLHQNQNGTYTAAAGIPGVAAGTTYQMKDQSLYNGAFQILRSF